MVNIHHINDTAPPVKTPRDSSGKTGNKDAFTSALNRALDKAQPSEEHAPAPQALGEITSVRTIQIPAQSDLVSGSTEKLLELLDTLSAQLQNPGVSLKHMAPVLETIRSRADQLAKDAQTLGSDHAGLQEIANQTAVTAQTEYIKFQRGDYLS